MSQGSYPWPIVLKLSAPLILYYSAAGANLNLARDVNTAANIATGALGNIL